MRDSEGGAQEKSTIKKEGLIKNWIEEVLGEVQNIFAMSYVLLIVIGMINETFYYNKFEINIFEYSQVWDFLIAPFKRPESIVFLLIAIAVATGGYMLDRGIEKKAPRLHAALNFGAAKKSWFGLYRAGSGVVVFLLLLLFYANEVADKRKEALYESEQASVEVVMNAETSIRGNKIGSNVNFIFLLDTAKLVQVIPINTKVEKIYMLQAK